MCRLPHLWHRCTRIRLASGKTVALSNDLRYKIQAKINAMAQRPLRCLGLAVKEGGDLGPLERLENEEAGEVGWAWW